MAEIKNQTAAEKAPAKAARQGRSPAFPFIPLGKALERVEAFRIAEGGRPRHFSPIASACAAWAMGSKTGPAQQTIAALGHFGLLEFEGTGEKRSARPTELALNILLDKQPVSAERDELIRQAALKPVIHNELWAKWQANLPSEPTLETYLVRDRHFSESGARDLIVEYKNTIAFAKLAQPAIIPSADETDVRPKVGDLVQFEIAGALQFKAPKAVRAINELDGKHWVFVEGETAGIPMEQVTIVGSGAQPATNTAPILPIEPGWHEERLIDEAGDEIIVRFKGKPSPERYEYVRDYYGFKIGRLGKSKLKKGDE